MITLFRDNERKRIKMEEHFSLIKHENSKGQSLECDGRLNHMVVWIPWIEGEKRGKIEDSGE
jgi:hypothetical protein